LFFSKTAKDESAPDFFQGLGKNTCSLQPALKHCTRPLKFKQRNML